MPMTQGELFDWALARALTINNEVSVVRNRLIAHCFICGERLSKGNGQQATKGGVRYAVSGTCYLCKGCADMVRNCARHFP